jgi:hypothetical protein
MGRLYLVAGMVVLLTPFLLASLLADLTKRQAMIFAILALCGVGIFVFYNTDTFDDLMRRWRLPHMPSDERQFVSAIARIRSNAAEDENGRHLEVLRAALCRTPLQVTGWVGEVVNAFDSSSKKEKVMLVKISPHITIRTSFSGDPTNTAIAAGSDLFKVASSLSSGDPVSFSGSFVTDSGSCDRRHNVEDALQDPNFVFLFSEIRRA